MEHQPSERASERQPQYRHRDINSVHQRWGRSYRLPRTWLIGLLGVWFKPTKNCSGHAFHAVSSFENAVLYALSLFPIEPSLRNTQTLCSWTFAIRLFTKFSDPFKRLAKGIFTALARGPRLGSMSPGCKLRNERGNSKSILSGADVRPEQMSLSLLFFGVGLRSAFPLPDCYEVVFFVCTGREACLTIYWLSTISMKPNISSSK